MVALASRARTSSRGKVSLPLVIVVREAKSVERRTASLQQQVA